MSKRTNVLAIASMLTIVSFPHPAAAQMGLGTWVLQRTGNDTVDVTLKVDACCHGGRRLSYAVTAPKGTSMSLIIESPFDGSDAPLTIGGKPTGETMAITRVDDRHATAVIKYNGEQVGTYRATISPDGSTLTVARDNTAPYPGQHVGKVEEIWKKK